MRYGKALGEDGLRKLLVDHEDGFTVPVLSKRYGISERTIMRVLAEARIRKVSNRKFSRKPIEPAPPPRPVKPCGTNAAYIRHIRKGEKPCVPCCDAHAAEQQKWSKTRC